MKRGGRHLMLLVLGLIFVAACTPSVPEQYIQPDDMEDILYDYHVSQGMAVKETGGTDYYRNLYFKAVLEKYGVTQEEFDSSLVYYYTRADKFISMYKNVQERLAEEALVRGASVSEVNRYTSTSLSGDTADIWEGQRTAVLMAQRPYHLMQFYQKADTSYHAGDSFLMTFGSHFLSQGRNRTTTLYVAVTYENDSAYSMNTIVGGYGETTLRIPVCKYRAKDIRGFVAMDTRLEENQQNDMCMLFLDRIQLIRFHNEVPEEKPVVATPDSVNAQRPDSLKADSLRRPARRLGERPGPTAAKPQLEKPNFQMNKPITR